MFNPRSTRSPTPAGLPLGYFCMNVQSALHAEPDFKCRAGSVPGRRMFNPRSTRSPTAKTANRLSVFTPLLQHILQDFASIRHIQNACNGKKIKNQVRNSRRFRVRSGFAPVSSLRYMF